MQRNNTIYNDDFDSFFSEFIFGFILYFFLYYKIQGFGEKNRIILGSLIKEKTCSLFCFPYTKLS